MPLYLYKGASWSDLVTYTVPEGVRVIVGEAFNHCSELTSVTLPSTLLTLGKNSFINCGELESIVVATGNTVYDSRNNCNAVIETATNKLLAGCNETIIPNTVSIIGSHAFCGLFNLESIVIPNSVVEICSGAFRFCYELKSVVFMSNQYLSGVFKGSDGIEGAFSYCNSQLSFYLNEIGESNIIDDEISGTWDDAP